MTEQAEVPEGRELTAAEQAAIQAQTRLMERDGLGIGLCGAHRTGKTSLCERLSSKNPMIPFVRTSAKAAALEYGFDVNNPGPFPARLAWQEYLLSVFEATYEQQDGIFFTDRTPLDMAAYLLADAPLGEIDPEIDARVIAYVEKCIRMTNAYFGAVILVQPGIPFMPTEGSPAPNRGYQEKLNALMAGLMKRIDRPTFTLERDLTDFQKRLNAIAEITSTTLAGYRLLLNTLPRQ